MPGMFGNNPLLMLIAIGIVMVAIVAFALMTAWLLGGLTDNEHLIGSHVWKTYIHAVSNQHY